MRGAKIISQNPADFARNSFELCSIHTVFRFSLRSELWPARPAFVKTLKHIKEGSGGAVVHSPEKIVKQWESGEIINMIWQDPIVTMRLAKKAKEIGIIDKELTIKDVYDLRFENELMVAQEEIYGETN